MILEHIETGLRVRVVEEKDELTPVYANGKAAKPVVIGRRLVTEGGQFVRASYEPGGRFFQVGTNVGVMQMVRVED